MITRATMSWKFIKNLNGGGELKMKKVLIIVSIVVAIGLSFIGGWWLRGNNFQKEINASIQPAENTINEVVSGGSLSKTYSETSKTFKKTETSEKFSETLSPLKSAIITSNKTYNGDYDKQSIYELTKDSKTYTVVIGTSKEDGKWAVSSLVVTTADQ